MLDAVGWLRRVKREFVCFDQRIGLTHKPRRAGWTREGSPLFDCVEPIHMNIGSGQADDLMLVVALFTPLDYRGAFDATIQLRCGTNTISRRLCRPPGWKRHAFDLRALDGPGAERSNRGLHVELTFSNLHAEELRLTELKLRRNSDWRLKTRVQGVSFPRSGHHMQVDLLEDYFGPSFQYCEFYEVCHQRPCPATVNHLQKSHDDGLDLRVDEDLDYLIQYRHPLFAIASEFELGVRRGTIDDAEQVWQPFAVDKLGRWKAWVQKWVLDNKNPRALLFAYEEVLADPPAALARLAMFFAPDDPLDRDQIRRVLEKRPVASRRTLEQFRHFESGFFEKLESLIEPELRALPILSRARVQ
jgi:hypothetical protein